jgi:hypothetical protein
MPVIIHDLHFPPLEIRCEFDYSPADPGNTSGPVENCYPPEPEEFELTSFALKLPSGKYFDLFPLILELELTGKIEEIAYAELDREGNFDYPDPPELETNYEE